MTDDLIPVEVFETDTMNDERWAEFLRWADETAEAGRDVMLDEVPDSARWQCVTESDAAWAMAQLREHLVVLDQVAEMAELYRQRIDAWEAKRTARHSAGAAALEAHLSAWAHRRREVDPDVKTLHLPTGKISTRQVNETVKIEDPATVVDWAKASGYGDAVKVAESVQVSTLKTLGRFVDVVESTAVRLQCGDETMVDGDAKVGEVCGCRMHPGDLVMIDEILGHTSNRVFVAGPDAEPVPGTRVEPARIGVKVEPDAVTPDQYA